MVPVVPVVPRVQAPVTAPANVSHGEARVSAGTVTAPVSAVAPPRSTQHLQRIRLEISNATVPVGDGVQYAAWTFGRTVPVGGGAMGILRADARLAGVSLDRAHRDSPMRGVDLK